ncbi:hypothetical protein HYU11_03225 [Candidatus Woesearchaeota archaeon]|nr:hypothetical protein [Candidatus Woesearchaeota archaeon]
MKKIIGLLLVAVLAIALVPSALAMHDFGSGIATASAHSSATAISTGGFKHFGFKHFGSGGFASASAHSSATAISMGKKGGKHFWGGGGFASASAHSSANAFASGRNSFASAMSSARAFASS